jgi:RNA exonuclease NGL2
MTGNIAQILALQSNAHPNVGFVVGNTHMYWRPTSNYERFRQAVIYSNRFLELKSELPTTMKWIPFLLGDFNTTPDDPVYGILTIGELTNEHIEDLNVSRSLTASASPEEIDSCIEPEEDPTSGEAISIDNLDTVDQLVKKYQKCQWTSIYSNYGKIDQDVNQQGLFGEPKFSNYCSQFKGLLDYMFIDSSVTTSIKRILMPPKEEFMKPSLPNRNFGSDHLCLVADIEY